MRFRHRVAFVQPWFPQYRSEFFQALIEASAAAGIEVRIFHGEPPLDVRGRGDAIRASSAEPLPTRRFRVGQQELERKSLKGLLDTGPWDLVVVEQAIKNIETYELLWRGNRLAMWGHGRTYTKQVSGLQERFKRHLTLKSSWFFSYTSGGATAVMNAGFPSDRITVTNNTIDASKLRAQIRAVNESAIEDFRSEHKARGPIVSFIGGLSESKRLDLLLAAARELGASDHDATIIVAGDGPMSSRVKSQAGSSQNLRYIGPTFGERKAVLLAASSALAIPGRVGLVAIDSFAAGIPIVTTNWSWHAPEFEYLEPGSDSIICAEDPSSFAEAIRVAVSTRDSARLRAASSAKFDRYQLDAMVDSFVGGLVQALS